MFSVALALCACGDKDANNVAAKATQRAGDATAQTSAVINRSASDLNRLTNAGESGASGIAPVDAARLLTQASFGATSTTLANTMKHESVSSWINEQMSLPPSLHLPSVQAYGNSSLRPPRHYVWWETALKADDQLRQRVAFALSEIFVVSDIDYTLGNSQHGIVHFYDMLVTSAFGHFRELLEDITLHPVMGVYLSMVRNEKANEAENIRPDENYAREIMQLFTIGLHELNAGGTPVPKNDPRPAYTQTDVEELSRVFTGWNFADSPEWQSSDLTKYDKMTPMVPQKAHHDSGSKTLVGGVKVPAGLSVREDLEFALDTLFNHANVGPFISKALIQRLITSNPSEEYVARVASIFNDNGDGVRGDIGSVIKAILLDKDARQPELIADNKARLNYGKLKEPLIKTTQIMRALNARPGVKSKQKYHLFSKTNDAADDLYGQAVQSSPSVFNFFSPDYRSSHIAAGSMSEPLYAPELQILTESLVSVANNDLHSLLYTANNRAGAKRRSAILNIDEPIAVLRTGRDNYIEGMNLLLMSGGMTKTMRSVLEEFIVERISGFDVANPQSDATLDQTLSSMSDEDLEPVVLDSLFIMLASPEFMVQR